MPFTVSFAEAQVAQAAAELNVPIRILKGSCEERKTHLSCRSDSILISTVKPAEEGDGIIIRLYESLGTVSDGELTLPSNAEIYSCTMDEQPQELLACGAKLSLRCKPFEIVTLFVRPSWKTEKTENVNML